MREPNELPLPLENAQYLHELNAANPAGSDRLQQGDDHIRLIKAALKATFPNLNGPVNATADWLNNKISAGLVPFGIISLFYGAAPPSGWAICNGQTVDKSDGSGRVALPDLRDRVPCGASDARPLGWTGGQWGRTVTTNGAGAHGHDWSMAAAGVHNHGGRVADTALSVTQMPAHSHGNGVVDNEASAFPYGTKPSSGNANLNLDRGAAPYQGITEVMGSGEGHSHGVYDDGNHVHAFAIGATPDHSHSVSVDVTQPTVAVHYIMKI